RQILFCKSGFQVKGEQVEFVTQKFVVRLESGAPSQVMEQFKRCLKEFQRDLKVRKRHRWNGSHMFAGKPSTLEFLKLRSQWSKTVQRDTQAKPLLDVRCVHQISLSHLRLERVQSSILSKKSSKCVCLLCCFHYQLLNLLFDARPSPLCNCVYRSRLF